MKYRKYYLSIAVLIVFVGYFGYSIIDATINIKQNTEPKEHKELVSSLESLRFIVSEYQNNNQIVSTYKSLNDDYSILIMSIPKSQSSKFTEIVKSTTINNISNNAKISRGANFRGTSLWYSFLDISKLNTLNLLTVNHADIEYVGEHAMTFKLDKNQSFAIRANNNNQNVIFNEPSTG